MDNAADDAARRARSARFATMPIVLAGTIAVTAGLTGPVAHAEPRHDDAAKKRHVDEDRNVGHRPVLGTAVARPATTTATTVAAVSKAPTTYTVRQGDTVSGIAARFGLSAQEVLVRNGLGWNTIIHPGQTLHLSSAPAAPTAAPASTGGSGSYHVKSGDTVSGIAARVGVSTSAILSANNLTQRSAIYPGQTLTIPRAGTAAKPAPVATTAPAAPAVTQATSVKIAAGDTIGAIAAKHGVSVKALLAANGLSYTSTIYAGKTLVLPSASTKPTTTPTGTAVTTTVGSVNGVELTGEQRRNAATIVAVGRTLGVPDRGIVIALAAALQESSLRNLSHGDRDSVGLFQQRPSQGWGTTAALQDPATAAELFYTGNPGKTRGLMDVRGWSSMSLTAAAQAVQVSAYPDEYAKWEQTARALLASL
ncbi:LysM peptidoglycan-binding domain-containing protein [Curtobacterium sp. MCSS17_007]|uniref:LysM peptidoglycan-binding domain-containing protein n=1 Tax=Curtobacterium sp. MCSS17_007 TaxID=2175646 RepID=UPI0021AD47E0|nr:LysM peptidoglycan-binding domain-containing protein [Curtobacterium sp. MCSS17_007]WIE76828.1 LysM peptidoglycan-binding domain-containing protein [Curtobacterium sp. MCSS17_007]